MEMRPQLKVSSDRLEKPGFEIATPGSQGKWLIHYTTAAPLFEPYYNHMVPKLDMYQGFSYLFEVTARGLLNFWKKVIKPSKLGKLDPVKIKLDPNFKLIYQFKAVTCCIGFLYLLLKICIIM